MLNGTCADIDECSDKESCQQICNNTIGSYTCSCEPGFSLNITDRKSCISCQSWTYGLNCTSNCSCDIPNTETCNAKNGDCSCKSGWNGTYCEADINECANQSVCPENSSCVNVNGSFDCTCDRGYSKTSDKFLCKECDDYMYGDDCLENCTCNVETTNACNNVNGSCYCKKGWEGERCSLDTNECSENVTLCWNKANSTCKNEAGSFRCDCNEGFREQDGFCTDCDQWQFGKDCESNCTCNVTKSEYCNQISGICVCKSGWNGTNCQDDVDECDIENICPDNSSCENTLGSFECKCNLGYTETDNGQCNDVDECNATETCHQICSNTIGSFTCSCKLGFSLNITDKTSCTSCQPWTYGQNCESKCNCEIPNTEICNATNGECTCKTGWYGTYCEDDINECANKSVCPENSLCVNLNGSFDCNCDRGYVKTDDKRCKECENFMYGDNCSQNCTCNVNTTHVCNNVNGSCYCKEGWEGELCSRDIDECSEDVTICQTKTNSTCENEDGSFRCECDDGFREQGDICTDCDQWKYGENCGSNCACDVNRTMFCDPKTGMCMCKSGWNGSNCQDDINECDIDDICPDNSSCENKLGSFECKCNLGYSENETGNCEMCDSRHYGDNCSKDCSCSFENTNHCNHITGFCNCLQGWKGDNCSVDINECESNEDVCKEKVNSTCSNTIGSYDCNCIPGFKEEEKLV
ncbi:multiple epidermal growth factor-like domains protein 10 isoform X1 [Mercenaria mercenaria]|uniref:multiple epidermal growth factor-like domains protein 10 isoform X1 n=1 Tax=Mercenaria mercenaria TaxID=6596 RepID=UPI00234F5350|nr:multiple epidermal growth factor-like domains protein 10 isoform X1 [Mercenaria mercenaria]